MNGQTVRDVQEKILEIMLYIDAICRKNEITYFIMCGTALGAVRHGGFIPWDDDLDIFMTPGEYGRFKKAFEAADNGVFVLQEWRTTPRYLEYAKVRMNGTTLIEKAFKDRTDIHQGIYVDIMILHKCPLGGWKQRVLYIQSKYVTLYALSQRNWRPKNKKQKIMLSVLKILPNKLLAAWCYQNIYRYDRLWQEHKWCYFMEKGNFRQSIFEKDMFSNAEDILFEGHKLMAPRKIKEYLACWYGDYMKLPPEEQRQAAVHAYIYDTQKDYSTYIKG